MIKSIIDNKVDYRGEILVKHRIINPDLPAYAIGDRVAQLIILPYITFTSSHFSDTLDDSNRSGGFGSTGK